MRRFTSKIMMILVTVLCCTLLHTPVAAADKSCGDNITWSVIDGTLYLKGSGEMYDYEEADVPWMDYKLQILHVAAEPTITSIGDNAFHGFFRLETADLPAVTEMGSHAFADCTALKTVSAPQLTAIPAYAFHDCRSLTAIDAPAVTAIGDFAFGSCSALESAEFPALLTMGNGVFEYCSSLRHISMPALTAMGEDAFLDCTALTEVTLPALTEMGEESFYRCSGLTAVNMPALTQVSHKAFYFCTALENVQLPKAASIGVGCFSNCSSLTTITLPAAKEMGRSAFSKCTALGVVNLPALEATSSNAFMECTALHAVSLPAVKTVGSGSFFQCASLQHLALPSATFISYYAFSDCPALESISLTTALQTIDNDAFSNCPKLARVEYDGTAADWNKLVIGNGNEPLLHVMLWVNPFADVTIDDYFYLPVLWAVAHDITTGTSETTFSPHDPCTRAQIVTFLWRHAGSPAPAGDEMPFEDVPADAYYRHAVLWAAEQGITTGTTATTFSPDKTCTRGEIITLLWRHAGSPAPTVNNPFIDNEEGTFCYEAILWALENRITTGISEVMFDTWAPCTRAHGVTFLYRGELD